MPLEVKIMLVGDSGVGKSSIINTFMNDNKFGTVEMTNIVDMFFKKITLKKNNKQMKVYFSLINFKAEFLGLLWFKRS